MKYVIVISYDGSKYSGLQKLNGELTVQGELENVLTTLNKSFVSVKSASRTDKGVHAINQYCHFTLDKKITPYKLKYYLNRMTCRYLYIKDCVVANDNFHVRFSAISKTYEYKINVGEYLPFASDYLYNLNKNLDLNLIVSACNFLLGIHDYRAFVASASGECISLIEKINVSQDENIVTINITGKSFYTHMIRNIISVLCLIGIKKYPPEIISLMLMQKKKIFEYSPAPAGGLYLVNVEYEKNH